MIITPENAEVIFVNHSGGKDSQAMLIRLIKMGYKSKIVIVHADLGIMEWEPMENWIKENSFGLPVHVVVGELDFFELCRKYKRIPGGVSRFCTNELKTKPCTDFMKEYCYRRGFTKAITALGIRWEESPNRAENIEFSERLKGGLCKTVIDGEEIRFKLNLTIWNPILEMVKDEVFASILEAGQDSHWVYAKGYSRLSCVFCPYAKINEHAQMKHDRPELFQKIAELEVELGKTIHVKQVKGEKVRKYITEYQWEGDHYLKLQAEKDRKTALRKAEKAKALMEKLASA